MQWLRPAFQAPTELRLRAAQAEMEVAASTAAMAWPNQAPAQFIALRTALVRGGPGHAQDLAGRFNKPPTPARLRNMLKTLVALGQARDTGGGGYAA